MFSSTEKFDLDLEGKPSRYSVNGGNSKVCHLTVVNGFILTFLALTIAVLVGVVVNFSGNNKEVVCKCDCGNGNSGSGATLPNVQLTTTAMLTTTGPTGNVPDVCKELAKNGTYEICSICPGDISTEEPTSTQSPTAATPPRITDVRLPTSLQPVHYNVRLRPEMYNNNPQTFTFSGEVQITMECKYQTDNVTLHMNKLQLNSNPVLTGSDSNDLYQSHQEDKERQFLIIHVATALIVGQTYVLRLNFWGNLTYDLEGLYRSSYVNENNETVHLAFTQFQPTDARRAFPCFDEPALKATFNITLERKTDSNLMTLSNMPLLKSIPLADGYTQDIFEESVNMSTYLVAFAFSDFLNKSKNSSRGTEFRTFSRPEYIDQTDYALNIGVEILDKFESYFNIDYMLPKLDNIAVPDFAAGAMENWGLVTYWEPGMLYEENVTTTSSQEWLAEVVSHELAHKWFGNLVSPAWWDDLWLNEGFATFLSYLGVELTRPQYKMMDLMVMRTNHYVMGGDSYSTSHPLFQPVALPNEINAIFDSITYSKGSAVIRMMWFFLGNETFQHGLSDYLKKHEYGSVTHADLWASLTQRAKADGHDLDVGTIMDTWILQMNYPVVTVSYDASTKKVHVSQRRFLLDSVTDSTHDEYMWEIPFTYTTNIDTDFNSSNANITWIHKTEATKTFDGVSIPSDNDGWIIGNIQECGYFRVNYTDSNWNSLQRQLQTNHTVIHLLNRAQLISDSWALSRAGMIGIETALDMLKYLGSETEYIPWLAALTELGFIDTMLESTPAYGQYEKFMLGILTDQFKDIKDNIAKIQSSSMQDRFKASLIVRRACHHHLQECENMATELYSKWINSNDLIPPDLKATVTCVAVREGGVDEWEQMYNLSKTSSSDARLALSAMACSKRHWLLSRQLAYSINANKIRRQDMRFSLLSVASNPEGFHLAWTFVMENWRTITGLNPGIWTLNNIIVTLSNGLRTDFDRSRLEHWKNTIHPQDGPTLSGFDEAIAKIQVNQKWHNDNYGNLEAWLNAHSG